MKLAHAYWSHDEVERAGKWASRAVALGTDDADAFVLIGHAARDAGDSAAALSAYRKYLREAPNGWHAPRVRAAVRELKAAQAAEGTISASN
jgi:regulator of sirC expression with transglutaminase-like and TPR domain